MSNIFTGALSGLLGRFFASAVSNAAGYGVGGAILPTLEPLTQSLANEAWQLHTAKPIPVGLAAEAALRGYMSVDDAAEEAAMTGFNGDRFAVLRRVHGQAPPLEMLLDLRRRDAITEGQLDAGLAQGGMLPEWRERLKARRFVLPSVTDMVRFAVREVYDAGARAALDLDAEYPGAFEADAERIGLAPATARNYWAAHWELPSYTQATAMLFRGEITRDQFGRLLKALDYAPTWRGPLEAIARAIPPIADMIRFAVREVYDPQARAQLGLDAEYPAAFTGKAAMHGMAEQDARDYWAAHWRLPSALQGYRMLWRGEISKAQLDGLLKALDYPPVWRDRLANIAHLVPGRIDLKRMFRFGILTREQVVAGYIRLGYTPADAEHMTAIAEAEQSRSETGSPWANRARGRLFTVAHNEYLDWSIDDARARELLRQVGAAPAETDTILTLWQTERSVQRLELTPAQIRKAWKEGLLDETVALAELAERGHTPEDAATFLNS